MDPGSPTPHAVSEVGGEVEALGTEPTPSRVANGVLIFVDGTCLFCVGLVAFLLRRDRASELHFSHLQGETARVVLERHGLAVDIDAIYAVTGFGTSDERVWLDGAAGRLIWPRIYRLASVLRFVPLWLLNLHYRSFARVRYRLFGQADACIVPTEAQRQRFLP